MFRQRLFIVLIAILFTLPFIASATQPAGNNVIALSVNGIINPVSAEFIVANIQKASDAEAIVIELDTPGGLMDSMRDIIKAIIASPTPVIVYVSPGGARAASAGAFITMAAHVAAMTPGTNIGAAHPVGASGKLDDVTSAKATNDAVAYIKGLAAEHGRNVQWAEDAVRNSVSVTAEEALELNVIDYISPSLDKLLATIDGLTVKTSAGERVLNTSGAEVRRISMSLRHRILDLVSNPNVSYILMILGFYGLYFEMTNPGAIFPGVVGAICLILAFYAMQTLPVNYAGLLLILLAIILFVLETQITSYGALAIGGIAAMTMGSLMLFDSNEPFMRVSLSLVISTTVITALFFSFAIGLVLRAHRNKPSTGQEGMIGLTGTALTDINKEGGQVKAHGEIWRATSDTPIEKGANIEVVSAVNLNLKVKKKDTEA